MPALTNGFRASGEYFYPDASSRHTTSVTRREPRRQCSRQDLDGVADRLGAAIQATADGSQGLMWSVCSDLLKYGGAKGIRTPDLLDANESRYQLRHSP
jgi:hypothetical protein